MMVGSGKRGYSQKGDDGDNKNLRRRTEYRNNGDDHLIAYRILCPDRLIGTVIGKGGIIINSIRQDTRAKVKVVDPFPGAKDRVITIYCYVKEKEDVEVDDEFGDKPLCAAQEALLRVHAAIVNAVTIVGDSDRKRKDREDREVREDREECNLLVPASQTANIIGKSGATIKKLRIKTKCGIKVTPKVVTDPTHACAMEYDNFVQISGESDTVVKALFAVSAIMYKFSPKEEVPLDTKVPEVLPTIIIPSDVPIYAAPAYYPTSDPTLHSRSLPSILGNHVPELSGYADIGTSVPVYSSTLSGISKYSGPSRSEEMAVKVLCPADKIGRVIGKGGSTIKSIRHNSGAQIHVDDSKNNHDDCVITVTSTEKSDESSFTAIEAVLLLQEKINEDGDVVSMRLVVPSKNIGCIIGKNGSIINEIRKRTRADIRISKTEQPKFSDSTGERIEVFGEVKNVRDALVQILSRLREDLLKDRDSSHNPSIGVDSLYASGGLPVTSVLPTVPSVNTLGYEQRAETRSGLSLLSDPLYKYGSLSMGVDSYSSLSSYSSKLYSSLTPTSMAEVLIPANAIAKVLGKGGGNLENLRQLSGAMIDISETKNSRGDRVAYISGTSEQKRTAQNLIQAFIMAT
ncbi:hypothetical protein Droror1_Dr00018250 [Drosera rotundifolia]